MHTIQTIIRDVTHRLIGGEVCYECAGAGR